MINNIKDESSINEKKSTFNVDFWYPRIDDNIKYIEVGLVDVRAADNIRISYDFEKDGYKIEQASIFEWEAGDKEYNEDWQEVAFIQAWGREKQKEKIDEN